MTLVEVVISLALVMILVGGIYAGVVHGIGANHASAQRITAFGLCKDLLETMRGAPYTDINTNVFAQTTVEIARLGPSGQMITGTRWTEITSFHYPPRRQVNVRLEWQYRNRLYEEFVTGVIYFRGRRLTGTTGGTLSGNVNLNPNLSPQNEFNMVMEDGTIITRADLDGGHPGISGTAAEIHFQPRGAGSQSSLLLNGDSFNISNARSYLIQGTSLDVQLVNSDPGQPTGNWVLSVQSPDALITVQ